MLSLVAANLFLELSLELKITVLSRFIPKPEETVKLSMMGNAKIMPSIVFASMARSSAAAFGYRCYDKMVVYTIKSFRVLGEQNKIV